MAQHQPSPRHAPSGLRRLASATIVGGLALALAGCGGMPTNRSLESAHQPVIERTNYTFDVPTLPDGGIEPAQLRRLSDWFSALGLKFGDRVSIDDPASSAVTRAAVEAVMSRFGLMLNGAAPVTEGALAGGTVRIVVSRTYASVPGCPDWKARSDANFNNATSRNFGCATNANMAAMVANKEDLVHGQTGVGDTVVMSNTKAIDTYRNKAATGAQALKQTSSQSTQ
ncbi:CpaD family pilus assembly protein [Novosphingobium nitrogenifigens]|nr:CpaD family pilus assembly protein [Novosphingobium nitrogenifigens]